MSICLASFWWFGRCLAKLGVRWGTMVGGVVWEACVLTAMVLIGLLSWAVLVVFLPLLAAKGLRKVWRLV